MARFKITIWDDLNLQGGFGIEVEAGEDYEDPETIEDLENATPATQAMYSAVGVLRMAMMMEGEESVFIDLEDEDKQEDVLADLNDIFYFINRKDDTTLN